MASSQSQSGGIGFFGLLGIVLIVLKLTGYIDWSWWWVLAPIWMPAFIFIIVAFVAFIIYVIVKKGKK